jgi:hypothetical protein
MGIDNFSTEDSSQQKQTHISFGNPDHPQVNATYADEEAQKRHFEAATGLQNTGINRKLIAGEFLDAVYKEVNGENPDAIEEFLEELTE